MTSPPGHSAHPAHLSEEGCHSGLEGASFSPNKQGRVTSGLLPGLLVAGDRSVTGCTEVTRYCLQRNGEGSRVAVSSAGWPLSTPGAG